VVPGTLDALVLPAKFDERPVTYRAAGHDKHAVGGDFVLSPDGRFLLCKTGTVLRLSAERDSDLQVHGRIEPFLAAAVDTESRSAFVLGRDGELKQYSYPEFRLRASYRLSLGAYQIVVDGKQGHLFAAGFDPRALTDRPRERGYGDIHVYDLKYLVRKE
jgi:hypothetical protein